VTLAVEVQSTCSEAWLTRSILTLRRFAGKKIGFLRTTHENLKILRYLYLQLFRDIVPMTTRVLARMRIVGGGAAALLQALAAERHCQKCKTDMHEVTSRNNRQ